MAKGKEPTYQIDGANVRFRNFAGGKTKFNPEGNRNFCVDIPPEDVDQLLADGWNVKFLDPREEGDDPTPYLQVKVKYDFKPPRVVLVKSNGQVNLTEDMVSILDFAELKNVDLIIRGWWYEMEATGKQGYSAYLKTMFATIEEDELERRYSTMDAPGIEE